MVNGLTTAALGQPNYELALKQHAAYIEALKQCGVEVLVLPPDEKYPDSIFIEDVALLTETCAIITNPGAPSRKGETAGIKEILRKYYGDIHEISDPGTVESGDIMMVGTHFFIGLSERTNLNGALQIISILKQNFLTGSTVKLNNVLHLKTGVSFLEQNNLVACGEFILKPDFEIFNKIKIDDDEAYAANCIWVNNKVIIPKGYPKARQTIEQAGYPTIEVDVSEFRKLDGGLSCLSLRF